MSNKNSTLHQCAQESEIDLVGVVNFGILSDFREILEKLDGKESVFQKGSMLDKIDYCKIWPQTKSIISFAMSYQTDIKRPNDNVLRGTIAKVAFGEDYHNVMREHAETLIHCMQEKIGSFRYQIYVDNCVLSDRIMAYCAGLGFYGKNGFIINQKYGSFLYLGHILVDIILEETSNTIENRCGKCQKCIKSCPTNALYDNRKFDYGKCISYLTQKGQGDPSSTYLYGCDLCQDACPYNSNSLCNVHHEFSTDSEKAFPALDHILFMSEEEFHKEYGKTSLAWKGLKTIKRNAKYILDNPYE